MATHVDIAAKLKQQLQSIDAKFKSNNADIDYTNILQTLLSLIPLVQADLVLSALLQATITLIQQAPQNGNQALDQGIVNNIVNAIIATLTNTSNQESSVNITLQTGDVSNLQAAQQDLGQRIAVLQTSDAGVRTDVSDLKSAQQDLGQRIAALQTSDAGVHALLKKKCGKDYYIFFPKHH